MAIPYERLQELYEIADGAYGDGAWKRGHAIAHLRANGHEYPARPDPTVADDASAATERNDG